MLKGEKFKPYTIRYKRETNKEQYKNIENSIRRSKDNCFTS